MQLELITPRTDLSTEFIQFMEEFQRHDEYRYDQELLLARKDFNEYVNGLINASKGIDLAPGYVAQTTFWTLAGQSNYHRYNSHSPYPDTSPGN